MTQFNPEGKDTLTYRECLDPAMKIIDQADADQYFDGYVKWQSKHMSEATGKYTPEEVCRINIGYWAVYYDFET